MLQILTAKPLLALVHYHYTILRIRMVHMVLLECRVTCYSCPRIASQDNGGEFGSGVPMKIAGSHEVKDKVGSDDAWVQRNCVHGHASPLCRWFVSAMRPCITLLTQTAIIRSDCHKRIMLASWH